MGWVGTHSEDVVMVALLRRGEPITAGDVTGDIESREWKRAFEREDYAPINLCAQNVETRLRRLQKRDLVDRVRMNDGYLLWTALEPDETREARLGPSDDDIEYAWGLAQDAEVSIELKLLNTDNGDLAVGRIRITSEKATHDDHFYPARKPWRTALDELLALA